MDKGMNIALSGLMAHQAAQDVTANNLANVNTAGFKPSATTMADRASDGVQISAIGRQMAQGGLQPTGNPLDLAVNGEGYFTVRDAAGMTTFTRNGSFHLDSEGYIVDAGGRRLQGEGGDLQAAGNGSVQIAADGTVNIIADDGTVQPAGQVALARFANPGGLAAAGDSRFNATPNSGLAQAGLPGADGRGQLVQGFLEMSAVDLVKEMTSLIVNEKAFAVNIKTVQTKDQMLGEVLDLKG